MRYVPLLLCSVALSAAAEVKIDSLEGTHSSGGTYRFPVVAGDSQAAKRINTYLQTAELQQLPGIYKEGPFALIWPQKDSNQGVTSMDYSISPSAPGLLSLTIADETMAAYPDSHTSTYTFDAHSGAAIEPADLFTEAGWQRIRQDVVKARVQRVKDYLAGKKVDDVQLAADDPDAADKRQLYEECLEYIQSDDLGRNDLTFDKDSLTLTREQCAPHVIQAMDDLWTFKNTLRYSDRTNDLSPYGRCLLVEQGADCRLDRKRIGPGVYYGSIGGKFPITLVLTSEQQYASGYFYDKYVTFIGLSAGGSKDKTRIRLNEGGDAPAYFDLALQADGSLKGTWQKQGKKPLDVVLKP